MNVPSLSKAGMNPNVFNGSRKEVSRGGGYIAARYSMQRTTADYVVWYV